MFLSNLSILQNVTFIHSKKCFSRTEAFHKISLKYTQNCLYPRMPHMQDTILFQPPAPPAPVCRPTVDQVSTSNIVTIGNDRGFENIFGWTCLILIELFCFHQVIHHDNLLSKHTNWIILKTWPNCFYFIRVYVGHLRNTVRGGRKVETKHKLTKPVVTLGH